MIRTTIQNRNFNLYEDIDEMPMKNWNRCTEFETMESGVGSTIQAVLQHLDRIALFAFKGMKEDLLQQRLNMHQCIWNCLRGIDFCLIQILTLTDENPGTENQAMDLVKINIEKSTEIATDIMIEKVSKLTKDLDVAIQKKDTNAVMLFARHLKISLPPFLIKYSKSFSSFDRSRIDDLKKKSTYNFRQYFHNVLTILKITITTLK